MRILEAFERRFDRGWYDEVHLQDVARDAGVTVQTVIRRFGGKDGLLKAAGDPSRKMAFRRSVVAGDRAGIVRSVIDDYEAMGDFINRVLNQEERHSSIRPMAEEMRRRVDGLVVALDFYVWKLIRRDMKRPTKEVQALMERLVDAVLGAPMGGKR
jgi:AcrR family transcriptional regulator